MQTKKRSPIYYGGSGCALGFIIMVCFVAAAQLAGPLLPISGQTYATVLNVGSWVLPIGLGVLGYFYGRSKQEVHRPKLESQIGESKSTGKKIAQKETPKIQRVLERLPIQDEQVDVDFPAKAERRSPQKGNMASKNSSSTAKSPFRICPKCGMKVLPKSDGTCPSCQSKIM